MTGKYAIIEGSYFSGLILATFVNPIFGISWGLANRPKMNDPAGPDWKLAVQRGMFLGACLTFATGLTGGANIWFIPLSAPMPFYYRMGLKLWPEGWIIGELIFGMALGLAFVIPYL